MSLWRQQATACMSPDGHACAALQGNLEGVSAATLDGLGAQLWMLAPPCQPFTRRGLQQDTADGRAASFLKLLSLLPVLQVGGLCPCQLGTDADVHACRVRFPSPARRGDD